MASGKPTDPRSLGGDIAGPGGPTDWHSVVLDLRRAVLLDDTHVAIAHLERRDGPGFAAVAMLLSGKVNRSQDRARVLYLLDADAVAAVVTELEALMRRAGPDWLAAYGQAKYARRAKIREAGG